MLGRILALLLALLLCLPVAWLPFATSVPALVWVSLAIVDVMVNTVLAQTQPAR